MKWVVHARTKYEKLFQDVSFKADFYSFNSVTPYLCQSFSVKNFLRALSALTEDTSFIWYFCNNTIILNLQCLCFTTLQMVLLEGNAQMTIVVKITKENDRIINLPRIKTVFKPSSFWKAGVHKYIYTHTHIYNIHIYMYLYLYLSIYTHTRQCRHMYDF